ncbi:glycosyl transferase family 1 [Streptomyces sp. WAC 01529]|uniref:glycosyltransferase n=1 Tax=Streptomyces sp. WAC 01529 TaxID=2203205 RepID=UPI000F6E0521|nr:glycosyltransferase [Streptomyces sp. WAC 01529]AZM54527.1 glycosyl transferase family 1 [Streptomyces sp. WAC 01529]
MPRILHVSQPVDGGVARVVTELAAAQAAAGLDVHVACPAEGTLPRALDAAGRGVRGHPWAASRSPGPGLRTEVAELNRVIDAVRPTLVHAHSAKAGLAARLALRGRVPTVFQPHAWSFEAVGGGTALLARFWERRAARWTDRVVCVSEAEWITGRRAGIAGSYVVVPNGVDVDHFSPGASRRARDRLLPTDFAPAPLVVCVGRLCRQKGQDVLLRAWASVTARVPGARLVLVGDGPDAGRLRAGADASVTFAGAARDTADWYRAADVVVLPSRWEGMALAPLEAMACGRPVVVTDVNGARESLPSAGRAHGLVPPEDPAALARALVALLRDAELRDALGRRGRRHVLDHHDARRAADAIDVVYRELLGAAPTKYRECTTT